MSTFKDLNVKIKGDITLSKLDELKNNIPNLGKKFADDLLYTARRIADSWKDTGATRDSLSIIKVGDNQYSIITTEPAALLIEYGRGKYAKYKKPFLREAVKITRKIRKKEFQIYLKTITTKRIKGRRKDAE